MRFLPLIALLPVVACADVTSPVDGLDLGGVVQVRDWFTSAWLVDSEAGTVLFDAGWREGRMATALEARGVAPSDVDVVVLTHGDSDHVGALGLYPGARVLALTAELPLIAEEQPAAVVEGIDDGAVLTLAGHTVEVFAVPGHTPGSAVYLVDGVLILGDAALQDRSGALVPVNESRSDDPAQARQSLSDLAARLVPRAAEIRWLAPAHSAPLEGFAPLQAFADAER